ncbi:WD40 repeat-like protein [Rhizopus microsporus]|uniref:WD40 repeat-like protein n=1 Tax=Rhizopus microsporus TaxID=58291 RepID=A0A1X0SGG2_RHIZD|nr:WD40 repeat-like protein [Rhizopus microsporus]
MSKDKERLNSFLFRHVPSQVSNKQKLCYRHRPDLVKNRGPDEFSAQQVQEEIERLPTADKEAISHIWSLFAAAPSDQRILILKGLISTCCMPQLSFLFNATQPLLRIDFVSVFPKEITLAIFSHLDAKSLCHAAQVSTKWKEIADDDQLWHRMCEQHIDKKCEKCGWGLPLLDKKTRSAYKRKRMTQPFISSPPRRRPWKDVYSERLIVERNWRNNNHSLLTLNGHTDGVMCVQFCEIAKLIITGSLDKTVRVWHLETGELIKTLTGHSRGVRALQFDDAKLVTGAMDNTLKIWNYHTGQCIRTLEGHTGGVLSLHFDSRILASGSTDHTIRVWNFDIGECCTLVGHSEWVNSVRICQQGQMLISSSDDATIRLWDLHSRSCIRVYRGHVGQVQPFKPSHSTASDLPIIISSSLDNTIKIWDLHSGQCLRTLFGHIQGIWGLDFDKLHIVSGSHDKTLRIWDTETGRCLYALEGHSSPVTAVALSDTKIISAADNGEIKIWDFGRIQK